MKEGKLMSPFCWGPRSKNYFSNFAVGFTCPVGNFCRHFTVFLWTVEKVPQKFSFINHLHFQPRPLFKAKQNHCLTKKTVINYQIGRARLIEGLCICENAPGPGKTCFLCFLPPPQWTQVVSMLLSDIFSKRENAETLFCLWPLF